MTQNGKQMKCTDCGGGIVDNKCQFDCNDPEYKIVCEEEGCDQILSINIHIFIMTRDARDKPFKDKESNMWVLGEEEKTICSECFSWYTPQNHNGWYDDEGKMKSMVNKINNKNKEII